MAKAPNHETLSDLRVFDVAKGVLVGARRCTVDEAFAELVARARQHQIGIFALSRALVAMSETGQATGDDEVAMAARSAWGPLLLDTASN